MKSIFLILALLLCSHAAYGQRRTNTSRGKLQVRPEAVTPAKSSIDSIFVLAEEVGVSGYEKTLRSRNESFMITNNTAQTIRDINFTIDYYDMKGRQMHQRTEKRRCDIPPGQTRMLVISAWDKQQVMYYHLSDMTRTRMQATPYDVKIRVNYITYDKNP